jgi:hypothetical protein
MDRIETIVTLVDYDCKRKKDIRWLAFILTRHVNTTQPRLIKTVFNKLHEEFCERYGRKPASMMTMAESEKGWTRVVVAGPVYEFDLVGERSGDKNV